VTRQNNHHAKNTRYTVFCIVFKPLFSDSSAYAHYVFNTFDHDRNGSLSFEVSSLILIGMEATNAEILSNHDFSEEKNLDFFLNQLNIFSNSAMFLCF
jgi:hypothetical protein